MGATLRAREAEQRRIDELEARLDEESERARMLASGTADAVKAADASAVALRHKLYALQAQLSESIRAREDSAAARAHAEAQLEAALAAPRALGGPDGPDGGGGGRLLAQLSDQLKAEATRRHELERISLGLQADLAAANALALQRAGEAAVGSGGRQPPQPPLFEASESAPRPPPALAARRVTAAAGAAATSKAGNARRAVAEPADPRALALTRPSYSVHASAVGMPAASLAADDDDDELWSFADGAVARRIGGAGGALGSTRPGAGGAGAQPGLPRLGSPFATAARGGLVGKGY